ncbi:hypothetical protein EX895_001935 [Sporisorium graminicola]|uniref:HMG box domain-containing protein n=1 Tax=Sporisorium graminicola TaxID=280036 RepID=A0A4U7KX80_9BASI|nr:hypothetical protein EX895_001935 [Sporisorium graminicola]TKY89404.1 hypothetical protein EX895_001935 [Sporisorium graminicola]
MNSQQLVSPQEAAAQAQARRMQPSDALGHHNHHHHGHAGSDDVSGGQYFNPAAMHSRNIGMDSGNQQSHYGGMQLPPLGAGQSNGGHGSMGHHAYGYGQSHAIPSQLSYPQHSPNPSHAHIPGGQNTGPMSMYGYGVHHSSPQQHYSHVPGQAAHGGMGGMVGGAGSNPMMGAPGGGSSGGDFGNHGFGQQSHYHQYFQPQSLQSISPSQAGAPPSANATAAPAATNAGAQPTTKGGKPAKAPKAPKAPKVDKKAAAAAAAAPAKAAPAPKGKAGKKGASADAPKAKSKAHPYAPPEPTVAEAKPTKKQKKSEDPPKPSTLKSRLKPPKQAPSAWQIFFTEELQKIKAQSPDERLNVAHVAKDAGQRYAALPESKKQEFHRRSLEAKEQWEQEMAEWKSKLTPEDIRQENLYRSAQRKAGKSRKGNLKDPNAPKKPLSAYFLFLRAIRADPNMTQAVFEGEQETTKQSVLAAAKWRSLSETEKQPYLDRAEADKARYERLRREYESSNGLES